MTKTPIELVEKWRRCAELRTCTCDDCQIECDMDKHHANELESALAAQWIPVEERLPLGPTDVWVAFGYGTMRECGYLLNGNWFLRGSRMPGVTHWMPIPPLPEKKETK